MGHLSPAFAIVFRQLTGIAAFLLVGVLLHPVDILGFLGTIAMLAVIILYSMANLALPSFIRREHPNHFSFWQHGVIPWIGPLALFPVLVVTVYPVPPRPYNLTPYLFVMALLIGVGYMHWLETRSPGVLEQGATMLVGRRTNAQGDLDWDAPAP